MRREGTGGEWACGAVWLMRLVRRVGVVVFCDDDDAWGEVGAIVGESMVMGKTNAGGISSISDCAFVRSA